MRPHPRLLATVAFVVILAAVAHFSGLRDNLNVNYLRALFVANPLEGSLIFVTLFSLGNLMHVPGLVFLVPAVLTLGKLWGGGLVYLAANISCLVTFLVFRWLGGNALQKLKSHWARKLLTGLHQRPVKVVTMLRVFLQTLPSLNVVLAMSGIKLRPYMLGNALGLPFPITFYCIFFDALFGALALG